MKNEHRKRDKDFFAEALAKEPDERVAYLDEACGNDQELKGRIQELLDAHDAATGFLEEPLGGVATDGMDRVGRFRILRELGRGGQGAVYLAEDEKLHRQVALKVLPSGINLAPHLLERFKREAEAASRLDHPGICSVFETGEAEGLHFIVMRYVEGESLANIIGRAREDPSRFKGGVFETSKTSKDPSSTGKESSGTGSGTARQDAVMRSVYCIEKAALAVHAAHEAGIIHRDIKPGNVMVSLDGDPVILDFGLARLEESDGADLTRSTDFLGTPAYMSPEQIRGDRKRIDRQTDIYSLGATLVECLTLRPPFESPTREGLYRAILTEAPPNPRSFNPRIPSDLGIILQTALAKNPDHRYKIALDFAEELRRVRQHEPILTRRAGPWLKVWRWSQRNPRLAAALGGIFLVLALGFAISTYQFGKTQLALRENERNADIWLLPYLEQQVEDELWPALPHRIKNMEIWVEKAEKLYGRLESHRRWIEMMRSENAAQPDQVRRDEISRMEASVEQLSRFEQLINKVKERINFAATVEEKTIVQHKEAWNATIEAIADKDKNPHYNGLLIEPRIGMIPIGQDPMSKLFEFAHLQTGEEARRDPVTNKLEITENTGLVMVLIPGGEFNMGSLPPSEKNPEGRPDVDPKYEDSECPRHPVILGPFFLSKYEMTQGQWFRVTGKNPSYYCPGSRQTGAETGADLRNPVEMVSWSDCDKVMRRINMVLPWEAQWEYACRAKTNTPWYTGQNPESLIGYENLADRGSRDRYGKDWMYEEWLVDYFMVTAPVGSLLPNPFGLHDMTGNVSEWCRDPYGIYFDDIVPGSGERIVFNYRWSTKCPVFRGGNFRTVAHYGRSAFRDGSRADDGLEFTLGLRPAMLIEKNTPKIEGEKIIPPVQKERLQEIKDRADQLALEKKYVEAEPLYRQLLDDHIHYLGEDRWKMPFYLDCLTWVIHNQKKYSKAEPLYRRLLANRIRYHGEESHLTDYARLGLAQVLFGLRMDAKAELLCRQVYREILVSYGEDNETTIRVLQDLTRAIMRQGKYTQAEPLCRKLLETLVRESGKEDPKTIWPRHRLGRVLLLLGRIEESETLFKLNMKISRNPWIQEHNATLGAMNNLAIVHFERNRYSEAKSLVESVIKIRNRTLGETSVNTLFSKSVLADVLREEGNLNEAESLCTKILDTARSALGEKHPDTIHYMRILALVYMELKKLSEAKELLSYAVHLADETQPAESLDRISYHKEYGRLLLEIKRFIEAEKQLKNAYEGYWMILGDEHLFTQDCLKILIVLYEDWGKPDKAEVHRALLVKEAEQPKDEDS